MSQLKALEMDMISFYSVARHGATMKSSCRMISFHSLMNSNNPASKAKRSLSSVVEILHMNISAEPWTPFRKKPSRSELTLSWTR